MVTGAAGYIGSHAALALLDRGHRVLGIDNMSRGNQWAVDVLERQGRDRFSFARVDLLDREGLLAAMRSVAPEVVIHFAALAQVAESVREPALYWKNNVEGTASLLSAMRACGVSKVVLSSTCATYGIPDEDSIPIVESCSQHPINPYGHSKLACERLILDEVSSGGASPMAAAILRYFNVAGCDPQVRLGEDHRPETHLIPICIEAALGQRPHIDVLGDDYATPDGTCLRDYVHVSDLVEAHLRSMGRLESGRAFIANVGTGRGTSVNEVLESCRRVTGRPIATRIAPRREGDPPSLVADASFIRRELGWTPRFTSIDETIATAWAWYRSRVR